MRRDRLKWNEKYQNQHCSDEPAAIVKQFAGLAGGKNALDIAAGNGRNSLFLARQGFVVDAVDIADVGLAQFAGKHPGIHTICADLDIVNIKYLNQRLFPFIQEGLVPGGVLIFETFLGSPNRAKNQPKCREYLLRKNELVQAFSSLKIILYKEAEGTDHDEAVCLASLVGIKTH
jgi:SAM-dependent methyltransferase